MGRLPNIWQAGAGGQLRARSIAVALAATLLAVACGAWPATTAAAPEIDSKQLTRALKGLPSDASPRQACGLLIKNKAIKASQEGQCRQLVAEGFDAAKAKSDSGTVTITSAAACAIQVLKGKAKAKGMGECSKQVAETASSADDGGGGFNPLGAAGDFVGGAVDTVTGAIGGAVSDTILAGFKAIIGLLFGGLQSAITVALIRWITTIPNLSGGHVGHLESNIAIGAAGLLAATMTISIVRFWGSGLTGDGAWAGAEGIARAAVAALLIGLWPQIFTLGLRLANALHAGILNNAVKTQLKSLFRDLDVIGLGGGVLTGGVVPMFLAIVIAIIGILMLLALVAMKIVITALTVVLFCAMPLAFVVWPIPELAAITRACLRALGVLLAIPVVWCLIFGAFAAIGADTFSFSNTGKEEGIFGTALNVAIVRPLVAIALLYLALVVPKRLLHLAPLMGGGGGGFGRALATGATLRAGFHYAPGVGRAALGRAQAVGASFGAAGAASSGGGQAAAAGGAASRSGKGPGVKDAAAAGGKAAGATLRDQTSQAPKEKGRGAAGSGEGEAASKPASGQASATQQGAAKVAAGDGAKGKGYAALGNEQHAQQMKRGGQFGGPATMAQDPGQLTGQVDRINKRMDTMAANSASGVAVSSAQVDGAIGSLQGRPDLLEAAGKASYCDTAGGGSGGKTLSAAEQSVGAFAEWAETDNPHVSDEHRSAFGVLGDASRPQRIAGMKRAGVAPPKTGSGPPQGRRVPPSESRSHGPSPGRSPRRQPGLD